MPARPSGFTLVELVVVLLLLALLGGMAAARYAGRADFDELAGADQVRAALRLAQTLAMSRTDANVSFQSSGANPASIDVRIGAASATGYPLTLANLDVTDATIGFNRLGQPSSAPSLTITGEGTPRTLCLDGETGYAFDC